MKFYPLLAIVALSSTAIAQDGPVTVWFKMKSADLSDKLAIICADQGSSIVEQDDRHVLCQKEVTGGKGILAQALLGNSYSTTPQLVVRFTILKDGEFSRVQASQWIELQMAGGQTRRNEINGQKNRRALEDTLVNAGGHTAPPELWDDMKTPGK